MSALASINQSINQSISHLLAITWGTKNTENTISTNGRYNQAETALIVDLETQINQLQLCSTQSLSHPEEQRRERLTRDQLENCRLNWRVCYKVCPRFNSCHSAFHKVPCWGRCCLFLYTAELSQVITQHGLRFHQYADDSQIHISTTVGQWGSTGCSEIYGMRQGH